MYSYDDDTELTPDIDALLRDDVAIDSFARDDEDFDRDTCANSLDEYLLALFADVDTHAHTGRDRVNEVSARAHAGVHENISAFAFALAMDVTRAMRERVLSMREQLTRDALDRALARATHPHARYVPPAQ